MSKGLKYKPKRNHRIKQIQNPTCLTAENRRFVFKQILPWSIFDLSKFDILQLDTIKWMTKNCKNSCGFTQLTFPFLSTRPEIDLNETLWIALSDASESLLFRLSFSELIPFDLDEYNKIAKDYCDTFM